MIIYTLRRLLLLLITLFFISLIGFALNFLAPHAPLHGISWLTSYWFYLGSVLNGDFGISTINGQLVSQQLREVLPATLELCVLAFLLALLVGIPLGIIAGVSRGRWPDHVISTLGLLGFSLPIFWLALLLILLFSLWLGWFPVSGRINLLYPLENITGFTLIDALLSPDPWRKEMVLDVLHHLVLPVITLAVAPTTEVIRLVRLSTNEVWHQNYIKAAATRGLSQWTIIRRHVLHNALPLLFPRLGWQFSTMLTLAMITEMVFSWPGMGHWLINALHQQDYAVISAGVVVTGALVITINILADIAGALANPLRHKEWYALR